MISHSNENPLIKFSQWFSFKKKKKSLDLAADYSRTLSFSNGRMNKTTINTVAAVGDFEGFLFDCFARPPEEEINRRGEEAQLDDKPDFYT